MVVRECKCFKSSKRYTIKTIDIDHMGVYYNCTHCQKRGFVEIHPRWSQ